MIVSLIIIMLKKKKIKTKKLLENPNALNKPKSIFSNLTEK